MPYSYLIAGLVLLIIIIILVAYYYFYTSGTSKDEVDDIEEKEKQKKEKDRQNNKEPVELVFSSKGRDGDEKFKINKLTLNKTDYLLDKDIDVSQSFKTYKYNLSDLLDNKLESGDKLTVDFRFEDSKSGRDVWVKNRKIYLKRGSENNSGILEYYNLPDYLDKDASDVGYFAWGGNFKATINVP